MNSPIKSNRIEINTGNQKGDKMEHFRIGENLEKDMKYCICREPWNRTKMIGCDYCEEWYHIACLSLKRSDVQKLKNIQWKCPKCELLDGQRSQFDKETIKLNFACPLIQQNEKNVGTTFEQEEDQKVMKSRTKIRENDAVILDDFDEKIENDGPHQFVRSLTEKNDKLMFRQEKDQKVMISGTKIRENDVVILDDFEKKIENDGDQFVRSLIEKNDELIFEQEEDQQVMKSGTNDLVILDDFDEKIENNGDQFVYTLNRKNKQFTCIEQEKDQNMIKSKTKNNCGNEEVILDNSDDEIENNGYEIVCEKIICIEQEEDQKFIKSEAINCKCEIVILDDSDEEIKNNDNQLVCQLMEKNETLIKESSNGLNSPDSEKSREIRTKRECQRRLEQRNYMALLKTQVPEIADMDKPSKLTILRKAMDYCHLLSNMDSQIRKDQAKELARNQMLTKKCKNSIFALKRQKILFICKDAII